MTKKEYKLVELLKNSIQHPERTDKGEILVWIDFSDLEEFRELVGPGFFDDGGHKVTMMDGYICFDGTELLGHFGIDIEIFDEQ